MTVGGRNLECREKLEVEGVMLSVGSGFASQVGCEQEKKETFQRKMDEEIQGIP